MNPLKNNMPTDFIDSLTQFLDKGGSPQQLIQHAMSRNPRAQQTIQQMQQMSKGMHPRDVMMQLAKQRGMDPNRVMQLAQRFGLK